MITCILFICHYILSSNLVMHLTIAVPLIATDQTMTQLHVFCSFANIVSSILVIHLTVTVPLIIMDQTMT